MLPRRFYAIPIICAVLAAGHGDAPVHAQQTGTWFEIAIDGFQCNHPVSDGALDHGDDVYLQWHAYEFDAQGGFELSSVGTSAVYGEAGHDRVTIRAGSGSRDGGLWSGDVIRGRNTAPTDSRLVDSRLPIVVNRFNLAQGHAVMLIPTIWRAHGDAFTWWLTRFGEHIPRVMSLATVRVRPWLDGSETRNYALMENGRATRADDWFIFRYAATASVPDGVDRPIGSHLDLGYPAFLPHAIVLNDRLAAANPIIALRYRDIGPHGDYTIFLSVRPVEGRYPGATSATARMSSITAAGLEFRRSSSNALQLRGGHTTDWIDVGGVLTSEPAAAGLPSGEAFVAARGQDNGIWVNTCAQAQCNGWTSIGGVLTSGPSVTASADGNVRVSAVGQDGRPWMNVYDAMKKKWSGWEPAR